MKNFVEIHIVPVWNEYEAVLDPIEHHQPDIVYLLEDENTDHPAYQDDLRRGITETGATLNTVSVDLFDMFAVMGSVTTLADRHSGQVVRVNVTSGTKHAAIGATMACMDAETVAQPYSIKPETPAVTETRPVSEPLTEATELEIYPIDSPTRDQLAALAVIDACNTDTRRTKFRNIIDEGVRLDFDCFRDSTEGKARYGKLRQYIIEPLQEKGYIDVDAASSKSKYVTVEESGRQTLRAFRHRIEDIIDTLESSSNPNVQFELDDPTESVKRWEESSVKP
ncbi:DUF6293 family protein [Saliphagus sp. GCM10025308]